MSEVPVRNSRPRIPCRRCRLRFRTRGDSRRINEEKKNEDCESRRRREIKPTEIIISLSGRRRENDRFDGRGATVGQLRSSVARNYLIKSRPSLSVGRAPRPLRASTC